MEQLRQAQRLARGSDEPFEDSDDGGLFARVGQRAGSALGLLGGQRQAHVRALATQQAGLHERGYGGCAAGDARGGDLGQLAARLDDRAERARAARRARSGDALDARACALGRLDEPHHLDDARLPARPREVVAPLGQPTAEQRREGCTEAALAEALAQVVEVLGRIRQQREQVLLAGREILGSGVVRAPRTMAVCGRSPAPGGSMSA